MIHEFTDTIDLRDFALEIMRDECKIGTPSVPSDGEPTDISWTWSAALPCGFDASASKEVFDGSQATITDAVVRMALSNTIAPEMRIQITKRHGITIAPEIYVVIGEPRRGISAQQVYLRRITGTSVL